MRSYASMCQKDSAGQRTSIEAALFSHALDSLDVIYSHRGVVSFLTTRLPDGCEFDEATGRYRPYALRGWPTFERAE